MPHRGTVSYGSHGIAAIRPVQGMVMSCVSAPPADRDPTAGLAGSSTGLSFDTDDKLRCEAGSGRRTFLRGGGPMVTDIQPTAGDHKRRPRPRRKLRGSVMTRRGQRRSPRSPRDGGGGHSPEAVRHHLRSALVFLGVLTLSGLLALFIYPPDRATHTEPPTRVTLFVPKEVTEVSVGVKATAKETRLTVTEAVFLSTLSADGKALQDRLKQLQIPTENIIGPVSAAGAPKCQPGCEPSLELTSRLDLVDGKSSWSVAPSPQLQLDARILAYQAPIVSWSFTATLPTEVSSVEANAARAQASLPHVDVVNLRDHKTPLTVKLHYVVPVANANVFDWSGSIPIPEEISPDSFTATVGSDSLPGVVVLTGTDQAQDSRDQQRLFLSGALIGVAGGALIGVVQETTGLTLRLRRSRRPADPRA